MSDVELHFVGWYHFKLFVEHASGISMDALHILVGYLLLWVAAALMRRPISSFLPWSALLLLEVGNEAYDLYIEVWPSLASQLGEGAKDIMLTMSIPTMTMALARWESNRFVGRVRQLPPGGTG
jgi:hypothetical protein